MKPRSQGRMVFNIEMIIQERIHSSHRHHQYMRNYFFIFLLFFLLPTNVSQAASVDAAGWIPWWQDTMGLKSATKHLNELSMVHPFAFSIKTDGTLLDQADLSEGKWKKFFKNAKRKDVDIIPTIMSSDGNLIHNILSDPDKRQDHIEEIIEMVEEGNFDGVDIDYEGKLADTKDYFSLFLKELKAELGKKILTCAIEARTPPDSRWRDIPATIEYANDYQAIAQHCDVISLMTYDQQRADIKLNDLRKGEPYMPVADVEWVEKVLLLALEDIPAEKIRLGVPTYGRQWELTVAADWYKDYKGNGAINLPDAEELADDNDVEIGRNNAGEASFTYFSEPYKILDVLPVPDNTRVGFEAAAKALLFANLTNITVPVNLVWYSDAEAIADKVDLAEKYNLLGIAIFKIDGEEDQKIWKLF